MVTVQDTVLDAAGIALSGVSVKIELVTGSETPGFYAGGSSTISFEKLATTDNSGAWSASLTPNASLSPYGSYYKVTYSLLSQLLQTFDIVVPSSGGPYWIGDILADTTGEIGVVSGGTLLSSMSYASSVTLSTTGAWTAITGFTLQVTPRGRPLLIRFSHGYVACASSTTTLFLDLYDVTGTPGRVDPNGDTCTKTLTTVGQSLDHTFGPFTPTAGAKTYQVYGYLVAAAPNAQFLAGAPVAFTQSFSRARMWAVEG
jgi:hypothetical protein